MSAAVGLQVALLVAMLAASFFFSGSETALFSLAAREPGTIDGDDPRSARVRRLLAQPHHLLVLLLLGNNAVNIVAVEVSHRLVENGARHFSLSPLATTALSVCIGTGLLLVAGEIGPKTVALQMPVALARTVAAPLLTLARLLAPLVTAFSGVSIAILQRMGLDRPLAAQVTEEELKTLVNVGEREGVLEEDEREMIGRVFDLGDTLVREVFVPRPDVIRVGAAATVEDVLAVAAQYGHARIPVVGDTIDEVRGICHVKDLIPRVREGRLTAPVADLVRPVAIVPDTKRVDDCLRDFQRQRIHLAVVVDEFGGTAGIVTLEDLVEQIVGDIFDEYDDFEAPIVQVDARQWRVDAGVSLSDLEEEWGDHVLPETEYDTLGGLVLELFGRFPYPGEAVEQRGVTYTVEKVARNRLQRVLVGFPEDGSIHPQDNGHGRSAPSAGGEAP